MYTRQSAKRDQLISISLIPFSVASAFEKKETKTSVVNANCRSNKSKCVSREANVFDCTNEEIF